jgi:hypothetical protein
MLKPTALSIALDVFNIKKVEKANKLLLSMLGTIVLYNEEVEKSNKLLKENERLRKKKEK